MGDYEDSEAAHRNAVSSDEENFPVSWRPGGRAGTAVLEPPVAAPARPEPRERPHAEARPAPPGLALETDRREKLVSRQRMVLGAALLVSVGIHMAVFSWSPSFRAQNMATSSRALQTIQLPPDVKIPPPPQAIARPATPKVAATDVSPALTIAPTTMEANPAAALPPPPPAANANVADRPTFIPFDVPPKLLNRAMVQKLLEQLYPAALRDAGIGGAVVVWAYVDTKGVVEKTFIKDSSGYPAMDAAAAKVVRDMRFKPAVARDQPIAVWISQSVTLSVKG